MIKNNNKNKNKSENSKKTTTTTTTTTPKQYPTTPSQKIKQENLQKHSIYYLIQKAK